MATRWMKWNESTHIFEYSTDGVSFNPLPLDASILTQGIIDPARLPDGGGGGGADPAGDNIFTGLNTFSGLTPTLQFSETDQGADAKNWNLSIENQVLKFRRLNDSFAAPADILSLTRAGKLTIATAAGVTHELAGNANGTTLLNIGNVNAGSGAHAGFTIQNDQGVQRSALIVTSGAYTPASGIVADGSHLINNANGGLHLLSNAGGILFKTNGVTRLSIAHTGEIFFASPPSFVDLVLTGNLAAVNATLSGGLTLSHAANGVIKERGRATPLGEWTNIAFNAANFTASSGAFTVAAGDQINLAYTVVGKTVTLDFNLQATTLTAATAEVRIALPTIGGVTNAGRISTASVFCISNGVTIWAIAETQAGVGYLRIRRGSSTGGIINLPAGTDNNYFMGQISYELA